MKDLTERKLVYLDDAIDAINEYFAMIGKLKRGGLTIEEKAIHLDTVDAIKALPPAQPERNRGRWNEYYRMHSGDTFACNRCGSCFVVLQGADKMNFCPNCGARMVQEGEDNDS